MMMEKAIENLERQVAQLSKLCSALYAENSTIKNDHRMAEKEAEKLREKNRVAYNRVERIIERLKSIEY